MTDYSVERVKNWVLPANEMDEVRFAQETHLVEILNIGDNPLWFRVDGHAPTPGGDDCYVVLPSKSRVVDTYAFPDMSIKLISPGGTAVSVVRRESHYESFY